MSEKKVAKSSIGLHDRKCPRRGTKAHQLWLSRVVEGKRDARQRRLECGLLTISETAHRYGLSRLFVSRLLDRGQLRAVEAGPRRLIHEDEAQRVLGGGPRREGTTAIEGARP
jgi:excisionase family DNA binding protein